MKNWSYTITDKNHEHVGETLYSGCYATTESYIFCLVYDIPYILIAKRGSGSADFPGLWNVPSGYLDASESAEQCCTRETLEETGILFSSSQMEFYGIVSDPELRNHGNVALRFYGHFKAYSLPQPVYRNINGEPDEVEEVKWVMCTPQELDKYEFAFGQKEAILEILSDTLEEIQNSAIVIL